MYRQSIIEATRCSVEDAPVVEELMRVDRPTLDALSVRDFNRLARESATALEYLREHDPATAAFYERWSA